MWYDRGRWHWNPLSINAFSEPRDILTKRMSMIFEILNKLIADPLSWPSARRVTCGAHDRPLQEGSACRVWGTRMGNVVERSRSPTGVEPATFQHIHSPHQATGSRPGIDLLPQHCRFDCIPDSEIVVQAWVRDPSSRLKARGVGGERHGGSISAWAQTPRRGRACERPTLDKEVQSPQSRSAQLLPPQHWETPGLTSTHRAQWQILPPRGRDPDRAFAACQR